MQLQPRDIKRFIADPQERLSFQSRFFNAMPSELKSSKKSVLSDVEVDSDDMEVEVEQSERSNNDVPLSEVLVVVPRDMEEKVENDGMDSDEVRPQQYFDQKKKAALYEYDESDNDDAQVVPVTEYAGDKFHIGTNTDLDFLIIRGKYGRSKNLESGERNELAKLVIKKFLIPRKI